MSERKLATVETIKSVTPIEGADRIEAIGVRGWTCVSGKGNFKVGDRAVYFEIDSALPLDKPQFAFLADHKKIYNGKEVHVLKTKRLRGVYSQGLCLPIQDFPEVMLLNRNLPREGEDVTELLGVEKWEPPVHASMGNMQPSGNFPTNLVRKTDSERAENLGKAWEELKAAGAWRWTEKLDGSSMSVVRDHNNELVVCSRNLALKESDNIYWRMVHKYKLDEKLTRPFQFVQGEVVGPGVQGNPLGLKENKFFAFDASEGAFAFSAIGLDFAPILKTAVLPDTIEELIAQVDGMKSSISKDRLAEGIVFWSDRNFGALDGRRSFKCISRKYLSRQSE